jgi:hypothetical protein
MIATTADRVARNTAQDVNARIAADTASRVHALRRHPERVPERLAALDAEWDIERTVQLNSAVLSLAGLALSLRDRRWLLLPAMVQAFFLQHTLQGWCPPIPILRRLGFRTAQEIDAERCALEGVADYCA